MKQTFSSLHSTHSERWRQWKGGTHRGKWPGSCRWSRRTDTQWCGAPCRGTANTNPRGVRGGPSQCDAWPTTWPDIKGARRESFATKNKVSCEKSWRYVWNHKPLVTWHNNGSDKNTSFAEEENLHVTSCQYRSRQRNTTAPPSSVSHCKRVLRKWKGLLKFPSVVQNKVKSQDLRSKSCFAKSTQLIIIYIIFKANMGFCYKFE